MEEYGYVQESGFGFGFGFGSHPLMTVLVIIFVVLAVGVIGRGLFVWIRNNNSPRQLVDAKVVTKRMRVSGHNYSTVRDVSAMHGFHSSTFTRYFVTFEMEGGKRLELHVSDQEFGMLAEGDQGKLSYQGTRYLGFDRV